MQYVRSISGSVSKTWNSINPATLSGAIDVIVVEHEDGSLACSPFHVRFGKFSLLRPSEKRVEFTVNGVKRDFPMKLGEGGEAFFVFETSNSIPEALQTSPLVSPTTSPDIGPHTPGGTPTLAEPDPLDLEALSDSPGKKRSDQSKSDRGIPIPHLERRTHSDDERPNTSDFAGSNDPTAHLHRAVTEISDRALAPTKSALSQSYEHPNDFLRAAERPKMLQRFETERSASPPALTSEEAMHRAIHLSKKLWGSNIPSQVTDKGDLKLDMTGYKSTDDEALRAEVIARKILSSELEGNYDIGSLIGADEKGDLWIYSSEERKEAAARKITEATHGLQPVAHKSTDAMSDPGYHSDDARSDLDVDYSRSQPIRQDSDSALGMSSPESSPSDQTAGDPNRNYAKTLRLTSDQLKTLELKPGQNSVSFSVNRATCSASIYLWRYDVPIVISDIDGTITKSDALGHVFNMIGRDWTHLGVAKLYTDIKSNGYNIMYLTSRSTGQADTTRAYLAGVVQEGGYKLPKGPVIMSPDRTIAALRREVYLRKPEVFKMACLRDIMALFSNTGGSKSMFVDPANPSHEANSGRTKGGSPFYAGFGNRFTDALSYRSVSIPSTRIFTINSSAEVSLDLPHLNTYKTGYSSMREIVDHFFPPVALLVKGGGEEFTDFNFWREQPLGIDEFSASESGDSDADVDDDEEEDDDDGAYDDEGEDYPLGSPTLSRGNRLETVMSEDEGAMGESFLSEGTHDPRQSLEDSILESIYGDPEGKGYFEDDEAIDEAGRTLGLRTENKDGADLATRIDPKEAGNSDGKEPVEKQDEHDLQAMASEDLKASERRYPAEDEDELRTDLKDLAKVLSEPAKS